MQGSGGSDFVITGVPSYAWGFITPGVTIKDVGSVSLNDVTEAPASGYTNGTDGAGSLELYEGHTYAFKLPGPAYGLLYIRSVSGGGPGLDIRVVVDYKYRSDGSRDF